MGAVAALRPEAFIPKVRTPSGIENVYDWMNDVRKPIEALGGSMDDVLDKQILNYLALASTKRDIPRYAQIYRSQNFPNLWRGLSRVLLAKAIGVSNVFGALIVTARDEDNAVIFIPSLVSLRVVTTAGVNAVIDALGNTFELELFNFHGIGTGTNAEAVGDTALQTEITTGLNPDNTRATGTKSEPSANVYQSVGTNTVDGTFAVTEHMLLSQAATGGGTGLDRSIFSAVNLTSGNQIDTTYQFTVNAGS